MTTGGGFSGGGGGGSGLTLAPFDPNLQNYDVALYQFTPAPVPADSTYDIVWDDAQIDGSGASVASALAVVLAAGVYHVDIAVNVATHSGGVVSVNLAGTLSSWQMPPASPAIIGGELPVSIVDSFLKDLPSGTVDDLLSFLRIQNYGPVVTDSMSFASFKLRKILY